MAVMFSPFLDEATKERFANGNLTSKFDYIDEHLSRNDYVLGAQFSVADAYLYNVLSWPHRVNIDITSYTNIQSFMARMNRRASVRAALAAEGLQVNG
jgi:glutathione S-transferase